MPAFTPAITFSVRLPDFEASVTRYDPLKEAQEVVEVSYVAEASIAAVRGVSSGLTVSARGVAVVTIIFAPVPQHRLREKYPPEMPLFFQHPGKH